MNFSRRGTPAANQLLEYGSKHKDDNESATTTSGNPLVEKDASLTVGKRGVILLQDYHQIDELSQFDRERIPERVVHAKGAGAFGYFEVTHDITAYSAAKVFSSIGKRTPVAVRFSQVSNEMGSADTVRDPRGFAIKFYTEDGIWDLVGNNTPIFFIRDSILFPSFIHILKRNPVTHVRDADMFWDFLSLRPESTHQLLILFSDRGIPDGYRRMHGYGSNTFGLVNSTGSFVYCKFHYLTDQGIQNIDQNRANQLGGENPDYSIRDLYNAIAKGDYPSWTFYIQVMTPHQAQLSLFNPFDVTKTWPHAQFPLIQVGKLVLNRNPSNYFAEVEQIAFNPAHLVPGIEPSPDRNLQGRLFSYGDTHLYRLGKNYQQIPVNSPFRMKNFSRDGFMTIDSQGGAPVYHPNSFGGPDNDARARKLFPTLAIAGESQRWDNGEEGDNFEQGRVLYQRVLNEAERTRLIQNLADAIRDCTDFVQQRTIRMFAQVDSDLGRRLTERVQAGQVQQHQYAEL